MDATMAHDALYKTQAWLYEDSLFQEWLLSRSSRILWFKGTPDLRSELTYTSGDSERFSRRLVYILDYQLAN